MMWQACLRPDFQPGQIAVASPAAIVQERLPGSRGVGPDNFNTAFVLILEQPIFQTAGIFLQTAFDELKVVRIYVEKGPVLKRFQARAKGRGNRIVKPTCHVFLAVGDGKKD